jgi:hypothetical protein
MFQQRIAALTAVNTKGPTAIFVRLIASTINELLEMMIGRALRDKILNLTNIPSQVVSHKPVKNLIQQSAAKFISILSVLVESRTLLATCIHTGFLLSLFLDPEDRRDIFPRNVGLFSTDYTALYPTR